MITSNGLQVLPIYVQHGAPLLSKCLARQFNQEQMHIRATYKLGSNGGRYTISNEAYLRLNGVELTSTILDLAGFAALIERVKTICSLEMNPILLCADANLGFPASEFMSEFFHALVQTIKPTCLVPFSETPLCVEDATLYLKGIRTKGGYQSPSPYRLSMASNQHGVGGTIQDLLEKIDITKKKEKKSCCYFLGSLFAYNRNVEVDDFILPVESNSSKLNLVGAFSM